eukprot:16440084-Heterocapsa_arctica.AAC.1
MVSGDALVAGGRAARLPLRDRRTCAERGRRCKLRGRHDPSRSIRSHRTRGRRSGGRGRGAVPRTSCGRSAPARTRRVRRAG